MGVPTYRASGFIYGLSENGMLPEKELQADIKTQFILLPHDLWGADSTCHVPHWPRDNDDWSEFNQFLEQLSEDVKASGMNGPDLQWDIWNEPDRKITRIGCWSSAGLL